MTAPDDKRKKKASKTASSEGFAMPGVDVQQLERLLDFMAAHELEEFEYEHGGLHIRLRKGAAVPRNVARTAAAPAIVHAQSAPPPHAPEIKAAIPEHPAPAPPAEDLHIIKSPIVGTFYAASSPDAAPFVKMGDEIQVGQVVCIIEAMKLMNEIESDIKGEVVRILAENSQPVEYGQPLFAIRPVATKK